MAKFRYTPDIPRRMYSYFASYDGTGAVPSFEKFARSLGTTLAVIDGFRKHKKFDEAYLECSEIRRDYLIDGALAKRFDSSFTKYILDVEYGDADSSDNEFSITLRVLE